MTSLVKVWESWLIYPQPLINQLSGLFARKEVLPRHEPENKFSQEPEEEDIDGIPVTLNSATNWKKPLDLNGSSLLTQYEETTDGIRIPIVYSDNEDIDGVPI